MAQYFGKTLSAFRISPTGVHSTSSPLAARISILLFSLFKVDYPALKNSGIHEMSIAILYPAKNRNVRAKKKPIRAKSRIGF